MASETQPAVGTLGHLKFHQIFFYLEMKNIYIFVISFVIHHASDSIFLQQDFNIQTAIFFLTWGQFHGILRGKHVFIVTEWSLLVIFCKAWGQIADRMKT